MCLERCGNRNVLAGPVDGFLGHGLTQPPAEGMFPVAPAPVPPSHPWLHVRGRL